MRKTKLSKVVVWLSVVMVMVVNLLPTTAYATSSGSGTISDRLSITTTIFPQYDFARAIVGDRADVTMVLPLGSESHNYEPSPSDIITIDSSDMFIYTGDYMEGWVSNIVGNLHDTTVVDVSQGITLDKTEDDDEEEEESESDHHHDYDPHIWTSPVNAMTIVNTICDAICQLDPTNADYYRANTQDYLQQLSQLDQDFKDVVANGNTNKIYFGGKFALYYLTKEYGLEYVSAYDSCSDETEPSAKAVAEIISEIKANSIPVVFYEELTDPKVANTIAEETGATPLLFHSCHNVTASEFNSGVTYISLMEQNVENLRLALNTDSSTNSTSSATTQDSNSNSILSTIRTLVSYPFMRQALIVGPLVSLCASLLGVSLVLKRYSMIGDGLSHVGFGALSIAMAFNLAPLKVSIPIVVVSAFFLLKLSQNSKIKGDSAIAIISSSALAIGVTITSLTSGLSTDINNYMFGSILSLSQSDVYLSVILSVLVVILFVVFYHKIFAVTFDENFSKATGIHADFYNFLIAILTAITIVIGMRLMGSLLISSLIIFPALSSMRVFNSFKSVIISSAVISVVCFLVGIFGSYVLGTPTGATIVIANLVVFLMFLLIGKATKRT